MRVGAKPWQACLSSPGPMRPRGPMSSSSDGHLAQLRKEWKLVPTLASARASSRTLGTRVLTHMWGICPESCSTLARQNTQLALPPPVFLESQCLPIAGNDPVIAMETPECVNLAWHPHPCDRAPAISTLCENSKEPTY